MSTGWQKIGWSTVWSRFVKIRSTSLAWQPTMLWNLRVTPMFGIHRNHWIRGLSQTLTLFSKSMNVPQIKADLCRQYSNSLCLVTVYWYLIPWFPRSDKISICLLVKSPLDYHQKRLRRCRGPMPGLKMTPFWSGSSMPMVTGKWLWLLGFLLIRGVFSGGVLSHRAPNHPSHYIDQFIIFYKYTYTYI